MEPWFALRDPSAFAPSGRSWRLTEENDVEEDCTAALVARDNPVRYSNSGADCQGRTAEAISENEVRP
jgi:hypothetical protein